ncbi:40S ribosomal protein S11 [Sciurus carolinensis]|uniref:40S ribosomal protein S11 n=1 Tax=Sciurus carolinensis TaxID=30640 RepID=A0AA41T361_SCICA|nr:40S ribosomal protein S11 [Sciurus carolinensis]
MAEVQTEHGHQKQPPTSQNKKRVLLAETGKLVQYKNIGVGFKTPKEAIEGASLSRNRPSLVTSPSKGRPC